MKKLTENIIKINAEVIGLDVHKVWTVYSHLDRRGNEVSTGKFRSRRSDLLAFVKSVIGRKKTHVAFEASRCSLWVYRVLEEALGKDRVHLAQAHKIRAIANSRQKNDANASWWLAYLTREGRLPEAYVPPETILDLRIATRERHSAVRSRTRVVNRLKSHLAQMGEVVPGSSIKSDKAVQFLAKMAIQTRGVRGRALLSCLEDLRFWDASISEWNEVIDEITDQLQEVSALQKQIPGMGPVVAATIIAEAGCIQRFGTAKSFAKYTGLTPSDRSSGGRTNHGAISREGSPHLRWALNQAIMACGRSRSGAGLLIGEWVRQRHKRLGSKKKAQAAAARKLSESVWRLFKLGECFDASRPFGRRRPA